MRLHHKIDQTRRDFTAVYECEHCGHQLTEHGYDDDYFHQSVIPSMVCEKCGEKAPDNAPDVPAHVVI